MRIGIISLMDGGPWGGSEELWANMAEEALKAGHDLVISVFRWDEKPTTIQSLEQKGASVLFRSHYRGRRLDPLRKLREKVTNIVQFKTSFSEFFGAKPDVICISQGDSFGSIAYPDLNAKLFAANIPFAIVVQNNYERFLTESERNIASKLFKKVNCAVFVSKGNWKNVERQVGISIPQGQIVQNPVNLTDLSIVCWPENTKIHLASVGRLDVRFKGQDILLEALGNDVWQNRNWQLNFYGSGADQNYLEKLATMYHISDRVKFMGYQPDVRKIWAENHLLVFPSRGEGMPLTVTEAMLCGRPIVATDVGSNIDWIEDGVTGYIAEAPTARSFGAALEKAWANRDNWRTMGLKAHEATEAKLDPNPGKILLDVLIDLTK